MRLNMIASTSRSILARIKIILWPIEKGEVKLFLPLALMMLCILFNFGALRSVKDGLVVPTIGAEVISFLKLWLVLPSSVLFTLAYVKLSNKYDFERLFYIIIAIFLSFFAFFAFVIFPNQDFYHPNADLTQCWCDAYPNFQWFIKIMGKWSYAVMYIFSELWSVVVINLMFWQFANHIFDTEKAKRFYPILGMIGNIGLILAGNILVKFSDMASLGENLLIDASLKDSQDQIGKMLQPIMTAIIIAGFIAIGLFRLINKIILKDLTLQHGFHKVSDDTVTKLSVKDSFRLIIQSKYIGHVVLLILCYGLLINILEGPWKAKVKELYPNTIDYVNFMGHFNIWMGVTCVTFMIIGSNILRNFSWLLSALVTPIMIAITGVIFFIFVIFGHDLDFFKGNFNPIYGAVLIGALQNILSKATKYSLFDSTKEMAYIPLSLELRTKGKAAVEVIGIKFGKSLGAFIQSTIFIFLPQATFDSITIYLLGIFMVIIILWLWNVIKLNKEYLKFFSS